MRAIRQHGNGGPETLRLERIALPEAGPGEVRIRVMAAGVNPIDWKLRQGYRAPVPESVGPRIPGFDVSGVIDQVGPDVGRWRVGDEVIAALGEVVALAEAGKLRVNVDQVFPLQRAAEAQEANRAGHTRGKIVIRVAGEDRP